MTPDEFAALEQRLGLRTGALAHVLRTTPRTVQRLRLGEMAVDGPREALLRLAAEVPAAREWLERGAPEDGRRRRQEAA